MWPSQRLIPRLFLQGDIIVSGQRAADSFLVPVAAMVTVRRSSSLHNPKAKPPHEPHSLSVDPISVLTDQSGLCLLRIPDNT